MLKICLVFWESEPPYAYKRYAYKNHVIDIYWQKTVSDDSLSTLNDLFISGLQQLVEVHLERKPLLILPICSRTIQIKHAHPTANLAPSLHSNLVLSDHSSSLAIERFDFIGGEIEWGVVASHRRGLVLGGECVRETFFCRSGANVFLAVCDYS